MPEMVRKRHLLLLEVLIAFAILVLCVLPLIYPHVYLIRFQREFIDKVELDQTANLIYAQILERLYRNEIPWTDIEAAKILPIDEQTLQSIGKNQVFPFKGMYQISVVRHKKEKDAPFEIYVLKVLMAFIPKNADRQALEDPKEAQRISYVYELFAARDLQAEPPNAPGGT